MIHSQRKILSKNSSRNLHHQGFLFPSSYVSYVRKGVVVSESEAHLGGYSINPEEAASCLGCLGSI